MLAPEQHPLKPATPIQAKNAPKTPNSHPQRRCRFHLRLGQHPQRRCRFQSHTSTSAQRRWRFQTTGPAGLQDPDAIPVGGGRAWPDNESTRQATRQHTRPHWCGGCRRDRRARLRCPRAAGPSQATHRHPDRLEAAARPAGPGRASSRRAERSSRRGRRAGGQATRRPEICRGNKHPAHAKSA